MSMEELRQMAFAYYKASTEDINLNVEAFTKEMDPENNGYVKFKEFFEYMVEIGHNPTSGVCSEEFFNELNQDGTGKLNRLDIMTLFYIVNGGFPFCDGYCKQFIKTNSYFTCVNCFENGRDASFNVCCNCFTNEKYEHHHKEFLDPTVLLNFIRMEKAFKNKPAAHQTSTTKYEQSAKYIGTSSSHVPQSLPSFSTFSALVPVENPPGENAERVEQVLAMMQALVSTGGAIAAAQSCTVM